MRRAETGTAHHSGWLASFLSAGHVAQEVDGQQWSPRAAIDCEVKAGVMELHGLITDDRLRPALRVIAENTGGVRGVRDHMVCVEPISGAVISQGSDDGSPAGLAG